MNKEGLVIEGIYKHYKGNNYCVLDIVNHSETNEKMVLYKALYDAGDYPHGTLWVRPFSMFLENVVVEGKTVPRFALVSDKST